jgi:uncharacterized protein YfaS (alpha-2-macroglobulin family)
LQLSKDLKETKNSTWKKDLTAVFLAGSYELLKQDELARDLISEGSLSAEIVPADEDFYDDLVYRALYLYIVSKHFPEMLEDLKPDDILGVVEPVVLNKYNTISAAYTILALDAYAGAVGPPAEHKLSLSEVRDAGSLKPLEMQGRLIRSSLFSDKARAIRVAGESKQYLFYQLTETGFDEELPKQIIKNGIELQKEYRNSDGEKVKSARLGERLKVHLKLRALGDKPVHNVALVDLFPAGFEVDVKRGAGAARDSLSNSDYSWRPQHVDIREDRVVIFGRLEKDVREFVYEIVAVSEGEFQIPPSFAESMYNPALQARTLGGHIVVGLE